jgi:hypothetical protein
VQHAEKAETLYSVQPCRTLARSRFRKAFGATLADDSDTIRRYTDDFRCVPCAAPAAHLSRFGNILASPPHYLEHACWTLEDPHALLSGRRGIGYAMQVRCYLIVWAHKGRTTGKGGELRILPDIILELEDIKSGACWMAALRYPRRQHGVHCGVQRHFLFSFLSNWRWTVRSLHCPESDL